MHASLQRITNRQPVCDKLSGGNDVQIIVVISIFSIDMCILYLSVVLNTLYNTCQVV